MITYKSQKQLTLEGFETPFDVKLDASNRWMKLSQCIPWGDLASGYYQNLSSTHGVNSSSKCNSLGKEEGIVRV